MRGVSYKLFPHFDDLVMHRFIFREISIYHAPNEVVALFFTTNEQKEIIRMIEAYRLGENNGDKMEKFLKDKTNIQLFSAKIIHKKEKGGYTVLRDGDKVIYHIIP